jgi:hypothetical protein
MNVGQAFGHRVVVSKSVPDDRMFGVPGGSQVAQVYRHESRIRVETGYQATDFGHAILTCRGKLRSTLTVSLPTGIVEGILGS